MKVFRVGQYTIIHKSLLLLVNPNIRIYHDTANDDDPQVAINNKDISDSNLKKAISTLENGYIVPSTSLNNIVDRGIIVLPSITSAAHDQLFGTPGNPFTSKYGIHLKEAERWLAAFYAANNNTPEAIEGKGEALGFCGVQEITHPGDSPSTTVHYLYPTYFAIERVDGTVAHSFDQGISKALPYDIDAFSWFKYITDFFSGGDKIANANKISLPTYTMNTTFPQVESDNTGISIADSLTANVKYLAKVSATGDYYFNGKYYSFSLGDTSTLKWATEWSIGEKLSDSLKPQGTSSQRTLSALTIVKYSPSHFSYDISLGGNEVHSPQAKANEYPLALHFDWSKPYVSDNSLYKPSIQTWITPTETSTDSHTYTKAVGQADLQGDIPFGCSGQHWPLLSFESSLTAGGITGQPPATDLFFGGDSSPNDSSPVPMIRSFGTGRLGLIAPGKKLTVGGARTFLGSNLTLALPFFNPFKALNNSEAEGLHSFADGADDTSINTCDFLGRCLSKGGFRPITTFDAAWLGGGSGFPDRSLLSAGGGGEFLFYGIHFDLLYEVTLHDSQASRQHLGENVIGLISYDIHY